MRYRIATLPLAAFVAISLQPLSAETDSESKRLEKLERAVEQLQERNAELETEVHDLRKRLASGTEVDPNGKKKTKAAPNEKTLLKKPIKTKKKPPVFVVQRGPEIKLTLGGYIQMNFEDGAVSAFEGRF